jgi:WD40 repeat protein
MAFSPNGQIVATASKDGDVRLWDLTTGVQRRTLKGHFGSINAVAFSPDGQMVVSASRDGTVRLWNLASGSETDIYRLEVPVTTLSFSANGCLNTDRGSLSLSRQPSDTVDQQGNEILVLEKWVTRKGQRLIWLPPEYRAICVLINGNNVVLGHRSGCLTFLWLN